MLGNNMSTGIFCSMSERNRAKTRPMECDNSNPDVSSANILEINDFISD
jgi:hypothetical protein